MEPEAILIFIFLQLSSGVMPVLLGQLFGSIVSMTY